MSTQEEINWKLVHENATGAGWQDLWSQDGPSTLEPQEGGLLFHSDKDQHDVIWLKPPVEGDVRIEYDFLPYESPGGTAILFIQATGEERGIYVRDILEWSDVRSGGDYDLYKSHMNYVSVSYTNPQDEVRFRQSLGFYLLERYEDADEVFERDAEHHICATKVGRRVSFEVTNKDSGETRTCEAEMRPEPAVTEGRIGLRLMNGRKARFSNFNVYTRRG
jgi:hypothetical protein